MKFYQQFGFLACTMLALTHSVKKKKELQKRQVNFADSSYSSLIKYNFVFYFIYKHKYENKSQEGLEGLSID